MSWSYGHALAWRTNTGTAALEGASMAPHFRVALEGTPWLHTSEKMHTPSPCLAMHTATEIHLHQLGVALQEC